jgi:hypothetical protein
VSEVGTPAQAFAAALESRRGWPRAGWQSERGDFRVTYLNGAYRIVVVRDGGGWREERDPTYRVPRRDLPGWLVSVQVAFGFATMFAVLAASGASRDEWRELWIPVFFAAGFAWDQVFRLALHRWYYWPTLRQMLLLRNTWREPKPRR